MDTCPARNTIRKAIMSVDDNMAALTIDQKNTNSVLAEMQEKLGVLFAQHQSIGKASAESDAIQHASLESMKNQKAQTIAAQSAKMSIDNTSPEELAARLKLTAHEQMELLKKNPPKYTEEQLDEHNRKLAAMSDNGELAPVDASKLINPTLEKNNAICKCPSVLEEKSPGIGKKIVKLADKYGFQSKICPGKPPNKCADIGGGPPPKKQYLINKDKFECTCKKRMAATYLQNICPSFGCTPTNVMGTYPSSMDTVNKSSSKSRPKGYSFPS